LLLLPLLMLLLLSQLLPLLLLLLLWMLLLLPSLLLLLLLLLLSLPLLPALLLPLLTCHWAVAAAAAAAAAAAVAAAAAAACAVAVAVAALLLYARSCTTVQSVVVRCRLGRAAAVSSSPCTSTRHQSNVRWAPVVRQPRHAHRSLLRRCQSLPSHSDRSDRRLLAMRAATCPRR